MSCQPLSPGQINQLQVATLVKEISAKFFLDEKIIAAMIYQESRGHSYAVRFEPAFFARCLRDKGRKDLNGYVPPIVPTIDTERIGRAMSWGVMQIMGETARSLGFKGKYLSELIKNDVNIELGCNLMRRHLDRLSALQSLDERYQYALMAYNGGIRKKYSPQVRAYSDKIIEHVKNGNYNKILNPVF